jgi:DNA-binding MarR family transcriptional regulator
VISASHKITSGQPVGSEAAIRTCVVAPLDGGATYRRALARRLGLEPLETAALLHVFAAGRLAAGELCSALALSSGQIDTLVERLIADGRLVRSAGPDAGLLAVAPRELERLAALMRPLDEELEALAAQMSADERAIVGRYLEAAAAVYERHAHAALDGDDPRSDSP